MEALFLNQAWSSLEHEVKTMKSSMKQVSVFSASFHFSARRPKRPNHVLALSLLLVLMASIGPRLARATTVDLWQNFPADQGENGFFTYEYTDATSTYQLLSGTGNSFYYRIDEVAGRRTNPALFPLGEGYIGYPWLPYSRLRKKTPC